MIGLATRASEDFIYMHNNNELGGIISTNSVTADRIREAQLCENVGENGDPTWQDNRNKRFVPSKWRTFSLKTDRVLRHLVSALF